MGSKEVTLGQLLESILDAQNRGNNLLGAMHNMQMQQAQQNAVPLQMLQDWKKSHPELSSRCKKNAEILHGMFEAYLDSMFDHLEEVSDPSNPFSIREFLDTYGQGYLQLTGMIQSIGNLAK